MQKMAKRSSADQAKIRSTRKAVMKLISTASILALCFSACSRPSAKTPSESSLRTATTNVAATATPEPKTTDQETRRDALIVRNSVLTSLKEVGFYTDWSLAGIPNGIPKTDHTFGDPISPSDNSASTASAINKAIQAAGDDVVATGGASPGNLRIVRLAEGIFELGNHAIVLDRSGVVLRGAGLGTVIRGTTGGDGAMVIGYKSDFTALTTIVSLTEDAKIGDDRITVADAKKYQVGQILKLDRYADDAPAAAGGSEWPNGHGQFMRRTRVTDYGPVSEGGRPVSQYIEIADIQGNVLVLANRINVNFPLTGASGKKLLPEVWNTNAERYKYIGIEDMKLQMTSATAELSNWSWHSPAINVLLSSSYSWVKSIESDGSYFSPETGHGFMGRHVELNGYRNQVTGGYFHHSACVSPGGSGYGIRWHGTDCVIDNNICTMLNKPFLGQTTNGGNVIAYNYSPNAIITPHDENGRYPWAATPNHPQVIEDQWNETAIDPSHGGYSHSDLFEGNYTVNIHTDSTSTNGFMAIYRNHSFGQGVRGTTGGSNNGLAIDGPQGNHASIGNVYLNAQTGKDAVVWDKPDERAKSGSFAVYRFNAQTGRGNGRLAEAMGSGLTNPIENSNWAFDRFYWAYDYHYVKNAIEPSRAKGWNVPQGDLPNSLHYFSAPDFFKGYVWPPVNPFGKTDGERVGSLPAKDRYDAMNPVDKKTGQGSNTPRLQ